MANPVHLAILKRGVEVWNKWREENSEIRPDLGEGDFCGATLSGVNLKGASLDFADLREADLTNADLSHAYLQDAILNGANLTQANLTHAEFTHMSAAEVNFTNADLRGARFSIVSFNRANLQGANLQQVNLGQEEPLRDANLSGANLSGAKINRTDIQNVNLEGAQLYETVFADVDLSSVKGLESCNHRGPSIVDHRTLMKSGPLPDVFLRGCGLPDILIEYLPTLQDAPAIQFYSCFISYTEVDRPFAERLYADLQTKGVRCWFAPQDMRIGDKPLLRIDESIRRYDKLLLIFSKNSIESDWVEHEVTQALKEEERRDKLVLFPIRIDDAVMKIEFGWAKSIREAHRPTGRHIGDFREWKDHDSYQKSFEQLIRDLKAEGRPGEGSANSE